MTALAKEVHDLFFWDIFGNLLWPWVVGDLRKSILGIAWVQTYRYRTKKNH